MSLLRISASVCSAALLLLTAKNKFEHPKASLLESVPIVDLYKAMLSKHVQDLKAAGEPEGGRPGGPDPAPRDVQKAEPAEEPVHKDELSNKDDLSTKDDLSNSRAQSKGTRRHFQHDTTGQTLDMGKGLETSGPDPLNRGPHK